MEEISREDLLDVMQQGGASSAGPAAAAPVAQQVQHQHLEQHDSDRDSWKDLYRVLIISLQHSSAQFQALTVEAITLGLWGLSSAHAALRDDIQGRVLCLQDRAVIKEFIYFAEWARAFEAGDTVQQLAQALCIPESAVVWYQPVSLPSRPAHLVAVDHSHKQLLLVVRGTTQVADVLADLVAHTSPLGPGQGHSGMLDCAAAIIQQCLPTLEQQLQQHPGYRVHCLGHSLGGGVAALAAYLLRNTAELRSRLSQASGVVATGFGTPPIMTKELAEAASSYTRTLVHNHDLVPRTCVASLAELRRELEQQKEAVFANNATMGWLRDSGVLEGGKALVASLCTYSAGGAAASRVAAVAARGSGMQRFMAAGLQVGATLLASKVKQMHDEAMAVPPPAAAAAGSGASSGSSNTGMQLWGKLLSQPALASSKTTEAATQQGGATNSSQDASSTQQQQQQQQQQQKLAEEQQASSIMLYSPGRLYLLKRTGVDDAASYELVAGINPGSSAAAQPVGHQAAAAAAEGAAGSEAAAAAAAAGNGQLAERFGRIIINRSMLRDHYLSHYVTGLHKLELQMLEEAAAA